MCGHKYHGDIYCNKYQINNTFESLAENLYMEVIVLIAYKNIPLSLQGTETWNLKKAKNLMTSQSKQFTVDKKSPTVRLWLIKCKYFGDAEWKATSFTGLKGYLPKTHMKKSGFWIPLRHCSPLSNRITCEVHVQGCRERGAGGKWRFRPGCMPPEPPRIVSSLLQVGPIFCIVTFAS